MKIYNLWQNLFRTLYHYLIFFLLVAFLVTCNMSTFVSILSKDLNLVLTEADLNRAAKLTFLNVIALSILFTLIDIIRRKLTIEKSTKHITSAARQIVQGNFDIRISPMKNLAMDQNYNEIINCFNKMAQELGSLETLRTDFIANVSHEMKTPLSIIQNYCTLLQTPNLSEEKRTEYAKGVTEGTHRMANMITNILKLNHLENQQIFPNTSEFNLGEQLCECLLQYENVWEKKEIDINTDISENVMITADRELLNLVWNNLFSNALKFTPSGGTVSIYLTTNETFAIVKIQDTGCGMSPEVGAHIFEKFYQGDTSHASQGNGLGLALVKRVIDILHGEITVESTVDVGTIFTVMIRQI